jgi:carboxyl-terminal processing protease
VTGVILDLRNNGGGYLSEAINLSGLFIKTGPVVQVKNSDGTVKVDSDKDPSVAYDGPLIVLTNRLSASASEIMAGALQDYGRALIVGDSSTFGKGTVQAVVQLGSILDQNGMSTKADPGALKLTIQKFYRASGQSTQLKGVIPDVVLPSLDDVMNVGEKMLDYPLNYDTIDSAKYDKVNMTQPYIETLRQRSQARTATNPDFVYLRQEMDIFKKMLAEKTVSLNEEQRLKEKKDADARVEARKKELLTRPPSKEKTYLITLKLADQPGLPEPQPATPPKKADKSATLPNNDLSSLPADDGVPSVDITLDETKRILGDLISLNKDHTTARLNR